MSRLLDAETPAGTHQVRVDAAPLAAGFYAYRLTVGGLSQTRQMLLLK